jgi:pyruvate dehydrogenase E2 component (dihydrolipoyllysine-residue acetyltransferase)
MYEFKMPSLGSDMMTGKLIEWSVKPGDPVKKGDIIAVVETSKSAVNVEIWKNGVIEKILVEPSEEEIPVGTVLALVRLDEGEITEEKEVSGTTPPPPSAPSEKKKPEIPTTFPPDAGRIAASPAARKRAQEFGLDLSKIQGTGPHGVISLEDVEKAIAAQTPSAGAGAPPKVTDKKLLMRQAIAAAMERANREIPHYYLETQVNLAKALKWLEKENQNKPPMERILYGALLLKAVALALKKVPELNGFYRNGRFEPSEAVHLGVAISLREGGLMAPAIHDVDKKSLKELMGSLQDLVERTRKEGLRSSELTDPTLTITSLGEEGVEKVFGVIYPPQVALVGFGRIYEAAVVEEGKVLPGRVITASLSADHRVSDGHRGAIFLTALNRFLQEPEKL